MSTRRADSDPFWDSIEQRLGGAFGRVTLTTDDGHVLALSVVQYRRRLIIVLYVDGTISPDWHKVTKSVDELAHEPGRYYAVRSYFVYRRKGRPSAQMKKSAKAIGIDLDAKIYQYRTYWPSPGPCLRHLRKHNPGLRLIGEKEYEDRVAELRLAKDEAA